MGNVYVNWWKSQSKLVNIFSKNTWILFGTTSKPSVNTVDLVKNNYCKTRALPRVKNHMHSLIQWKSQMGFCCPKVDFDIFRFHMEFKKTSNVNLWRAHPRARQNNYFLLILYCSKMFWKLIRTKSMLLSKRYLQVYLGTFH